MRIGLALRMIEEPESRGRIIPRWEHMQAQTLAAERAGFDLVTIADGVSEHGRGYWEAMTLAGALAASTTTIGIAHSVVNAPYREPAVVARAADTLDEITGGRYTLGIGAGNTPDDYRMFDMDADPRFSRFAERLKVIVSLLRTGTVDFDGQFEHAHADWWSPRGPRPQGPPIVVAAGGPKMVALTARLADGWNWWADTGGAPDHLPPILEQLNRACEVSGRDPSSVGRTVDMYSFDPLGMTDQPQFATGSAEEMADPIIGLADLGIDEVRIEVVAERSKLAEATEAMAEVVGLVHSA
jgi:alkanesulfonate monooxygenase SsuD/methylene tetrahydromethanopterin reductase-like flavin-dependent oxidoreductase (luciferase family)